MTRSDSALAQIGTMYNQIEQAATEASCFRELRDIEVVAITDRLAVCREGRGERGEGRGERGEGRGERGEGRGERGEGRGERGEGEGRGERGEGKG